MKPVAHLLCLAVIALGLVACNDNKTQVHVPDEDFALSEPEVETTPDYLYVSAPSGLTLRQHNNLNSEKLAVMPYGTKVKVITPETEKTMTVGGIKGGMHQVEFNHKTGYAFNGYLSQFFPPEEDMKPKAYAEALREAFPGVSYSESNGGSASNPSNTVVLRLPTDQWHEAFFIATELYGIPKNFAFPSPKGSPTETVQDTKKPANVQHSELVVNRSEDELSKIEYRYATEGFGYTVTISPENGMMQLERTETAD